MRGCHTAGVALRRRARAVGAADVQDACGGVASPFGGMLPGVKSHPGLQHAQPRVLPLQEPSLSLAFDYAEHDLYEMIRFHRERGGSGPPLDTYTIKSLVWQMLQVASLGHPCSPVEDLPSRLLVLLSLAAWSAIQQLSHVCSRCV